MRRLLFFIIATAPFLMCFQCGHGCENPDITTTLCIENATGEDLYLSRSAQPWANADCRWSRLPYSLHTGYLHPMSPGDIFRLLIGGDNTRYVLMVDADMRMRACWAVDSLPMADNTRWTTDSTLLDYTNCNGIHPTEYTYTFTLQPEHLQ